MNICCRRFMRILLLIAVLPSITDAAAPIGYFETPSPAGGAVIWDLTGAYEASGGGVTTNFQLDQDEKGKLTGSGTEVGVIDGVDVNLSYSILGFIASFPTRQQPGTTIVKVRLALRAVGTATYGGRTFPLAGLLTATFEITGNTMSGPTRVRLCARGLGCAAGRDFASFNLPQGAGNNWTLVADLQSADGRRLQGTGSVDLTNQRTVPLNFSGLYNAATDSFRLNSTRVSSARIAVQASASGTSMLLQKLRGKVMGQALN